VFAIDLPHARRLALRVVLGQAAVTVIVALVAWAIAGRNSGVSALLGGGIATLGSLAMAGVVFGGIASGGAARALGAFYTGEALKLTLVVVLFVAVLKLVRVVPLAMFAGFAGTYLVYWIALVGALPMTGAARGR
jgi:ATP synthase protein I